jgi:hypothetical protein
MDKLWKGTDKTKFTPAQITQIETTNEKAAYVIQTRINEHPEKLDKLDDKHKALYYEIIQPLAAKYELRLLAEQNAAAQAARADSNLQAAIKNKDVIGIITNFSSLDNRIRFSAGTTILKMLREKAIEQKAALAENLKEDKKLEESISEPMLNYIAALGIDTNIDSAVLKAIVSAIVNS